MIRNRKQLESGCIHTALSTDGIKQIVEGTTEEIILQAVIVEYEE